MKPYVLTTALVIATHVALELLWSPYRDLSISCGAMVSHGNDIADLPRQWLLGSVITGVVWIVVVGYVAFVRRTGP
jgi:hypothetical protein